MPTPSSAGSKILIYLAVVAGLIVVGLIDFVTGAAIRVVPLYFVPLGLAGWRLGRLGAAIASLVATLIWIAALNAEGGDYVQPYVTLINFLTQGVAFLTVSMLVAMLCEALRKERSLGRTDILTGLWNRWAFVEQASNALASCRRYGRPVALAYIDLDNFKNVNDSLGHAQGDALLQKFGKVIAESLRTTDIAARIGGDEFVAFLPETNAASAAALCERLRHALADSSDFRTLHVTASIGVVIDEAAREGIEQLLHHADTQMYRAKGDGKNRIELHYLGSQRAPA
jgi:diguanylate cyclase (GGDEF)-like protein